jgi:predicted RNase H-like HicB family nuclease
MEFDGKSKCFVTYVKELNGISTFGETEVDALNQPPNWMR